MDPALSKIISIYSNKRPKSAKNKSHVSLSANTFNKNNMINPNTLISKQKINSVQTKNIPSKIESELYYIENIGLKSEINKLNEEIIKLKSKLKQQQMEIGKKDKEVSNVLKTKFDLLNKSNDNSQYSEQLNNLNYCNLYNHVKRKYKQFKETFQIKEKELNEIKKVLKFTKINEIEITNKSYLDEIEKLKIIINIQQGINESLEKSLRKVVAENKEKIKLSKEYNFLIEQNRILDENVVTLKTTLNNYQTKKYLRNTNVRQIESFQIQKFHFSIISYTKLIQIKEEDKSFYEQKENDQSKINFRINRLSNENKSLINELNKIKSYNSSALKESNLINITHYNERNIEINQSNQEGTYSVIKSSNIVYNLFKNITEIEKKLLENEKYLRTLNFIFKSLFHINKVKIENLTKIFDHHDHDKCHIYRGLIKFFLKFTFLHDVIDLFSLNLIALNLIKEYELLGKAEFKTLINKKFFSNDFDHTIHLKAIIEVKSNIKMYENIKQLIHNLFENYFNKKDILTFSMLLKFLSAIKFKMNKELEFSFIYIMKYYNPLNENLSLFELNAQLIYDLIDDKPEEFILNKIKDMNKLKTENRELILNLLYTPKLEINYNDVVKILKLHEKLPTNTIYKKLIDYLNIKGLELDFQKSKYLYYFLENDELLNEILKNRKEILIKKKNDSSVFEDFDMTMNKDSSVIESPYKIMNETRNKNSTQKNKEYNSQMNSYIESINENMGTEIKNKKIKDFSEEIVEEYKFDS